jgi:hypothetical protein
MIDKRNIATQDPEGASRELAGEDRDHGRAKALHGVSEMTLAGLLLTCVPALRCAGWSLAASALTRDS